MEYILLSEYYGQYEVYYLSKKIHFVQLSYSCRLREISNCHQSNSLFSLNIDIKLPVTISEANPLIGLLNIFKEVEQGQKNYHIVYKTAGHIQFINLEVVS